MGTAFIKALKWSILVLFVIGGIYGLVSASENEDVKPLMMSVLCFGSVYMMFKSWSDLPGKIMIASAVIVVLMAFLAQPSYAPFWIYYYTGEPVKVGFYMMWSGLIATIGFLIMIGVFFKFDDD